MQSAWIESKDYIGPCRRTSLQGLRLVNKRRANRAHSEPALKTIVRQLRMTDLAFANAEAKRLFRLRLVAAHGIAERAGDTDASARLALLRDATESADDAALPAFAARCLDEIASHLGS